MGGRSAGTKDASTLGAVFAARSPLAALCLPSIQRPRRPRRPRRRRLASRRIAAAGGSSIRAAGKSGRAPVAEPLALFSADPRMLPLSAAYLAVRSAHPVPYPGTFPEVVPRSTPSRPSRESGRCRSGWPDPNVVRRRPCHGCATVVPRSCQPLPRPTAPPVSSVVQRSQRARRARPSGTLVEVVAWR